MPAGEIDGDRLLYHYLQKDLLKTDIWLFQMLATRLIVSLGVWLHPDVYERLPFLVPYAVRDPHSRGNRKLGVADSWGAPNEDGYFRDDNSLIKEVPRPLTIESRSSLFSGHRIGRGFVASHVWREINDGGLASRNPLTYSFVPNLVWLPAQVSALSDREGSFVQAYIQALSRKIYSHREMPSSVRALVAQAWALLPERAAIPEQGLPSIESLNFFRAEEPWIRARLDKIRAVAAALKAITNGQLLDGKIISSRYTAGLPTIVADRAAKLAQRLETLAA